MTLPPRRAPAPTLGLAKAAARDGDWITAHRICLQLTRENPDDEAAWLLGATTAQSVEDTLLMLGQVLKLNPANAEALHALHEALKERLRKDAFLAYDRDAETPGFAYLRTAGQLELLLPVRRIAAPLAEPQAARPAARWLSYAFVGLIPAGLGAVVCAPPAMLHALRLLAGRDASYRRQGALTLGLALGVFALGLALAALLLMHLAPG